MQQVGVLNLRESRVELFEHFQLQIEEVAASRHARQGAVALRHGCGECDERLAALWDLHGVDVVAVDGSILRLPRLCVVQHRVQLLHRN